MVLAVAVAAVVALSAVRLDLYAITPGHAKPIGPYIKVSGHRHDVPRRTILLTDVYLTQLNAWQWLWAKLNSSHEQIVSGSALTEPGVPTSELLAQGSLQMYDSQNNAKVAALTALHYNVSGTHAGVTVTAVGSKSPSFGTLDVADRIVGARGETVTDLCSLVTALHGARPGRPVTLSVRRADVSSSGVLSYAASTSVAVPTSAVPPGARRTGCPDAPTRSVWLGIGLEDAMQWTFPVHVTIDTANIIGPSAGLAMTLGIIDALSRGSLTSHVVIAATGTIDPSGNVGDVGGVAEKTVAVEAAGAKMFLVPAQEFEVASRAAQGGLKVVAVSSLDQALVAVERDGGRGRAR